MLNYLRSFTEKCAHKMTNKSLFNYISLTEILLYTIRQGYHLYKKTFTKYLNSYRKLGPNEAIMVTPYGSIYLPSQLDDIAISYLLRESLDSRHWHQYDTLWTPLHPEDVVVDCGASEGLWALSVIEKVQKIYLVEPQEVFVKSLQKTFAPYILTHKAVLLNCAVGAVDSMCNLVERFVADIEAKVLINQDGQIPLRCLDSLFDGQKVDFIKVDIEGHEMDLLLGAREVIRKNNPKLAIAVYHKGNNHLEMVEYVRSIVPAYNWRLKGMTNWGMPLMLHMWVPGK